MRLPIASRRGLALIAAVAAVLACLHGSWVRASAPQVPSLTWASAGSLLQPRAGTAAALLPDGSVLVTGGWGITAPGVLATVERYDPGTNGFLSGPPLQEGRSLHTATTLQDGRVLVTGGAGADGSSLFSAELYDPGASAWIATGSMSHARVGHTATLLRDGSVLIAGGRDGTTPANTLELFDPASGTFSSVTGTLTIPRSEHAAALLPDGRVLITGGFDGTNVLPSVDIYNPANHQVSAGPALLAARSAHSATTLLDGRVLVAGGVNLSTELTSAELFDPTTNAFTNPGHLFEARQHHAAILLPHNNTVLFVGGYGRGRVASTAEIYVPWQGTVGTFLVGPGPAVARAWGGVAALSVPASASVRTGPNDGLLLLAGGSASTNGTSPFANADLFGFATVNTDKDDYLRSETVTVTGGGFQPLETVTLTFDESPALETHQPIHVTADSTGHIHNANFVADAQTVGVTIYLTATGSKSLARTMFTDSGAATKLGMTRTPPNSITVGVPFLTRIAVQDSTGATVSTSTATITMSSSDGVLAGATTMNAVGGVASFPDLMFMSSGSHHLLATSPGLSAVATTANVVSAPTTTTLVSSTNSPSYGQSVALTATVVPIASGAPTGTVTFTDGATVLATETVSGGVATLTTSSLAASTIPHSISAVYSGDGNYLGSTSSALTETVTVVNTVASLTSSLNPSMFGDDVTFTATLSPVAPATTTPVGTVTFNDGAALLGTGTLNAAGQATFATATMPMTAHVITAVYAGDTNFTASTSPAVTQVVNQMSTSTAVGSSVNPSLFAHPTTLTATVSAFSGRPGTPTGTVQFTADDGSVLGTATVHGGGLKATVSTSGSSLHTCASTTLGGVVCWGNDSDGELGDGTTVSQRVTPVALVGLSTAVKAIAAGGFHTCALTTGGGVQCWGYGADGELGDDTYTSRDAADGVAAFPNGVAAITAGDYHTCALKSSNGSVYCWGRNDHGELGNGTTIGVRTPASNGLSSVKAISAGEFHTCAVTTGGAVMCWGYNLYGQLGNGTFDNSLAPVTVSGLSSGVTAISAGLYHTCALTTAGGVQCWGNNYDGELGDNSKTDRATPVQVSGLSSGVSAIAAGGYHTCALTTAGAVLCWGADEKGQLGDGSRADQLTPVAVLGLSSGAVAIAAGLEHTCALPTDTTIKCWGDNEYGQVGDGTENNRSSPTDVYRLQLLTVAGSVSVSTLDAGSHGITAAYSGDPTFVASTAPTFTQLVIPASTTTTMYTVDGGDFGETSTLMATVFPASYGLSSVLPTGTVTFLDGSTVLGTGTLDSGYASLNTLALSVGTPSITAVYGSDSRYAASTSAPWTGTTIPKGYPTLILVSSKTIPARGQSVTFTATVTGPGPVQPTGTVTFFDLSLSNGASTIFGTGTIDASGHAAVSTAFTVLGNHTITANYGGDGNFNWATDDYYESVNSANSTTSVTSSAISTMVTESVTFTATVTAAAPGSGTPTGTVTFKDGSKTLGTATLVSGQTTMTTAALTVGSHRMTAVYNGATDFSGSTSLSLTQTINQASTTTSLTSSPVVSGYGQAVTFTAKVVASPPASGTPTGTVRLTDGGTTIGTAALSQGVATLVASLASRGARDISAVYSGDATFAASTSPAVTQTIGQASTIAAVTSSADPSVPDQPVTFTANVNPASPAKGTPTGTVQFRDNGAPIGSAVTLTGAGAIASGSLHTCALQPAGRVVCWGNNTSGALGDGSLTNRKTPVAVTGLSSGVKAIAAGGFFTCALMTDGGVKCWGDNAAGQLGDGTKTNRLTPVSVSGLPGGVRAITAGDAYVCALTADGAVLCWGYNSAGQLGDGTTTGRVTPAGVLGLSNGVQTIGAGFSHACAVTLAGDVQCWGDNSFGELGNGTTGNSSTPVTVSGLSNAAQSIAVGADYSCVLTTAGAVQCWGVNGNHELGDGTTIDRPTPAVVTNLSSGVQAIAAGGYSTCALTPAGGVSCWGDNTWGQLGDGTTNNWATPVPISGLESGAQGIAPGASHTCALTLAGTVQCVGNNAYGQLGNGTTTSLATPTTVTGLDMSGATADISVAGLTAGSHAITAEYGGDANFLGSGVSVALTQSVTEVIRTQTIAFVALPGRTYGDADVAISATATSGLAVSFSATGDCSVSGNTVRLTGAGSCTVTAMQTGDATFSAAPSIPQTFSIAKLTATVTPDAAGKTYGAADPALTGTVSGFLAGDGVTATYSRTAGEATGGSPYTISATLMPAGVLDNYTITYNTASFTIGKATASVTPDAANKTYGTADPTFSGTLSGFLADDNVTAAYSRTGGETVGGSPYTIGATLVAASGVLDNYAITYNTAKFTIGRATAAVTPDAASKTYGAADPALTGTLSGFLAGDNVTASYSRTAGESVGASPYAISAVLNASSGVLDNYAITCNTAAFTIGKLAASVTPDAASKTYGAADPMFTGTLNGFVAGDHVTASYSRTAGESVGASPYTISATLNAASGVLDNYAITGNTAGFTIGAATASVTPDAAIKIYGAADPVFTGRLSGFLAADHVTASYSRTPGETVGSSPYTIRATLDAQGDGVLDNYAITYNTAALTIGKATASVTPNAAGKTYGAADPTLTGTLGGFLAGDNVTASYSRTPGESVGASPYTISATLRGNALENYAITSNTASFNIAAATLTVVANNAQRSYWDPLPALTGTVTGMVAGDPIAVSYMTTAAADSPAGSYAITPALSDPQGRLANYTVQLAAGTLTVLNPAPLVSLADPAFAAAGDPDLMVSITGDGLVPQSVVKLGTLALDTEFVSATSLRAVVPASSLASAGVQYLTVVDAAPGGGSSSPVAFFVNDTGVPIADTSTGTVTGGTATIAAGGEGPGTPDSLAAMATGSGTVSVAQYDGNPTEPTGFSASGGYFDVSVAGGSTLTTLVVTTCDLNGGTSILWYTGTAWLPVKPQTYDAAAGCVTMNLTSDGTSPTIGQLTGTYFAAVVPDAVTPGEMFGSGRIQSGAARAWFEFSVREKANGADRGRLRVESRTPASGKGKTHIPARNDRFVSDAVTSVVFSDDPATKPGKKNKPDTDTVVFKGTGRFNGRTGYQFEATAVDAGEPGRNRDTVTIVVRDAAGTIVLSLDGTIDRGNVQSVRVRE